MDAAGEVGDGLTDNSQAFPAKQTVKITSVLIGFGLRCGDAVTQALPNIFRRSSGGNILRLGASLFSQVPDISLMLGLDLIGALGQHLSRRHLIGIFWRQLLKSCNMRSIALTLLLLQVTRKLTRCVEEHILRLKDARITGHFASRERGALDVRLGLKAQIGASGFRVFRKLGKLNVSLTLRLF